MTTKVNSLADLMVETLTQAVVRRIYGVVRDSLNGFNDAASPRGDRVGCTYA
jgi:pyruvate dehydrogenase (quinone)